MKKFKTLILVILLVSSFFGYSQSEKTLLWEVSGNGLESPSYIFGTIHLICPDDLELSPKITRALENSKQLVLELDMDEPTFMSDIQKLSVNPELKNLSGSLSEQDLNTLNTFFKKHYQTDMTQLGIMKPIALNSMAAVKALDCPQPASFELALIEYGKKKDWETLGLETIQEQFTVFDNISESEQLEWLVSYANDETEMRELFTELISAYKAEDLIKMFDLFKKQPEFKKMENTLLYERNEKWINRITQIASQKSTFFAFGAAHLSSNRGVIELLMKEGYTVKPIMD